MPRPRWIGLVEALSVIVFGLLFGALFIRFTRNLSLETHWPVLAAGAALGVLMADFLSGFVHWFCDTFFEENSTLGRIWIAPFREHHRNPLALTRHGFLEKNGNNCLVALGPLVWAWVRGWPGGSGGWGLWAMSTLLFLTASVAVTNQIHCWAHTPRVPRPVRCMQRCYLILSPRLHERHHATGDAAYCVTFGWLNTILDRARFFKACEWVLSKSGVPRAAESLPG